MDQEVAARLESALAPRALQHGFELVAVELAGGQGAPIVRVYLDREDGIDIDAICAANEWVTVALDELDPFDGSYTLEVSSPGVDRPLTKLDDYLRFTGSTVSLKTRPIEGRSKHAGTIACVEGEVIVLDSDGTTIRIPFADVRSARLKGEVDFGKGKAGEKR